jgi:endonuclease III
MPTITNKQRLLNQLFACLGKRIEPDEQEVQPVLEQFIYGLCREGTTTERADEAFKNLRERFFDWNEVRVSSIRELEEALGDLPDAELRAERLVTFLQEVFEKTFSFELEKLHKLGLKEAAKLLNRYQASNEYITAWVVQHALGGHAIPVDAPTLRAVQRLGLIESEGEDPETVRASLEHLVPKAKGSAFVAVVSELASEYCWEDTPHCAACPLVGECPTGQESARGNGTVSHRHVRPKSR